MEKKLSFAYQKDGRLSSCKLIVQKDYVEFLEVTKEEPEIKFTYSEKKITIEKGTTEKENTEKENGKIIKLIKNHKILYEKVGKYFSTKLSFPLPILSEMGITEEEKTVTIKKGKKQIIIEKSKSDKLSFVKKEETHMEGKIITIKVNKGGVGKTFVSLQLGAYLSLLGKKVLLLTSDSQNNILDYSFGRKKITFDTGLKEFVAGREGEIIKLRENLNFIPLESSTFGSQFLMKLPNFLEKMRLEYDFILIDSIPTMKIDSTFVKCSDKIIIPVFCDEVTVNGAINVIKEAGVSKVLAVVINKYSNKKIQNLLLKQIKDSIEGTDIIFPEPIKSISDIEELLYKGKTIWESNSKNIEGVKNSIKVIGDKLLEKEETKNEFNFDF
jgi:chromosome partitioning protein